VEAEETFREMGEASKLKALVVSGDLSCPDTWPKGNRAECKQRRRFLESIQKQDLHSDLPKH